MSRQGDGPSLADGMTESKMEGWVAQQPSTCRKPHHVRRDDSKGESAGGKIAAD